MTRFNPSRRRFLATAAATGALLAAPSILRAQSYASRPVTVVVPNAAGGGNDLFARLIQPVLQEELGQPVLVENRPGAAGNIGLVYARDAEPDGHTLFCSSSGMMATAHTHQNAPGNPVDLFEHITMLAIGNFTFTIPASLGPKDYASFKEMVLAAPGDYRHGTPGAGANIHLSAELFKLNEGIDMPAIHYKGSADIMTDLLSNQIQMANNAISTTAPHIRAGMLVPIFTAGTERETEIQGVPTSAELGIKDVDRINNWYALHAPKGTPEDVLDQVHAAAVKAIGMDDAREKARAAGMKPVGDSREDFIARMKADDAIFASVAQATGIRVG
jgi:tripartite-type tricarboxylate transporter receptor subunit TctC